VSARERFALRPREAWPSLYLKRGGHWTPEGNLVAAEAIAGAIVDLRLLEPPESVARRR
jgi:hypothetical protein